RRGIWGQEFHKHMIITMCKCEYSQTRYQVLILHVFMFCLLIILRAPQIAQLVLLNIHAGFLNFLFFLKVLLNIHSIAMYDLCYIFFLT
ncbi:hypothetical protein ACJX0J_037271, partial [Zea mays]